MRYVVMLHDFIAQHRGLLSASYQMKMTVGMTMTIKHESREVQAMVLSGPHNYNYTEQVTA